MQWLSVVRQRSNCERVVQLLRWGRIPSWAKEESAASRLINVRCETLAEMASFRNAYKTRRCPVPAAGFYEWKSVSGGRQPYFIRPTDDSLFAFARLWERWNKPDGDVFGTYTILTTDSNEVMGELHDRMPVIVPPPEDYDLWLSREMHPEFVDRLLVPYDSARIRVHRVQSEWATSVTRAPDLVEEQRFFF